jgi:hypothetical protein
MVDFKALVPWRNNKPQTPATRGDDFFDPFVTFRREMDRMFDDFFGGGALRQAHAGWQALTPAVDIDETDKEMVITAELPGVSDKDVEVSLAGARWRNHSACVRALCWRHSGLAAREKALRVVAKLRDLRLTKAAELVETGVAETLAHYAFPYFTRSSGVLKRSSFSRWLEMTGLPVRRAKPVGEATSAPILGWQKLHHLAEFSLEALGSKARRLVQKFCQRRSLQCQHPKLRQDLLLTDAQAQRRVSLSAADASSELGSTTGLF